MLKLHGATRAALYARVSSEQQAEAGTIASQVAALRERIQADGLAVVEALCFVDDGHSGSTLLRPALERLRDAAADGEIDRLYLASPDRLARKYAYQFLLLEEFSRQGVETVFLNRPPGGTPEDDLLVQIQGVIAEYERAKILERSRRGKQHRARAGCVSVLGRAPYGYRYVDRQAGGGEARYEVVWEQARVVRQVFAWVGQERVSLAEAARRLARQGVPTPAGAARWRARAIWGMLRNPAYRGAAAYGKCRRGERQGRLRPRRGQPERGGRPFSTYDTAAQAVAVPVPALVSAELFAAAAEQLAENRRRHRQRASGARHLLQGLVVCQQCGYACCVTGNYRTPGGAARPGYYRCTGRDGARHGGRPLCRQGSLRADVLEAAVWEDVRALLADPGRVEAEYQRRLGPGGSGAAPADDLHRQRDRVSRGISRLIDAYAEGLVEKAEFEPRVRGLKERLARLEAEAEARAQAEEQEQGLRLALGRLQEFAGQVRSGLESADGPSRRAIVCALVKRVEVHAEEVRVVYRVPPDPFVERPDGGDVQHCLWRCVNGG
jgi:site-specific DNA recombinase